MKKEILVTSGTNDARGYTKATTANGYIKAAQRIWPYAGLCRVKIKVFDLKEDKKGNDPLIFETQTDLY